MHATLKAGGVAYFKVWGGCWPERGSGEGAADVERGTYQTHTWAAAHLSEVEAIFGRATASRTM